MIQFQDILVRAGQLILSLSILVVLHELGHFVPAKLFKTRVEKFYLFFNPWFSLFKFKKGETEYGIGWLPLGGFVKIAGMIDESMDKEQLNKEPEEWEFRSKPAWQRLIIMLGGVVVNVLVAIVIYCMVLFTWGESYVPMSSLPEGLTFDSIGQSYGLMSGDVLVKIQDEKVENFSDIPELLILEDPEYLTVNRKGEEIKVNIDRGLIGAVISSKRDFLPRTFFVVDSVLLDGGASKAGFMKNDSLVSINGQSVPYFDLFQVTTMSHQNDSMEVGFYRNGNLLTTHVLVDSLGKIGLAPRTSFRDLIETKEFSFIASFPAGLSWVWKKLKVNVLQFKYIFDGKAKAYKNVKSLIGIAQNLPKVWDWQYFWSFTAMISIALAVMNILPIPALDGGHAMFLIYEIVAGKKPSDKFMEYAQTFGMVLLLGLMLIVFGNDILNIILK